MRLHNLNIEGFGMFNTPQKFEFDPCGLTVVYGDNEMGKSTIRDAICATIFGFETVKEKNRYTPWYPSEFAASVTFSSEGKQYCIHRDFETDKVSVYQCDHQEEIIFQGCPNPRGRSLEYEQYCDFLRKAVGFSTPDIFRLTTLVEQMRTKTGISQEIRQLISGAEEADYVQIVESLKSELKGLTRNFPGSTRRKKGKIEEIGERINELSTAIDDAYDLVKAAGHYQAEIEDVKTQLHCSTNEYKTKQKSLESLESYIKIEDDIKTAQRRLEVFGKQVETLQTLQNFQKSIDSVTTESGLLQKIPLAVVMLTAVGAGVSWVVSRDLLLVISILGMGIVAFVILYFLSVRNVLSSGISRLKEASIHPENIEKIKDERDQLQKEILRLSPMKSALLSEYPSFAKADFDELTAFQEEIHMKMGILQEEIQNKEGHLDYLNQTLKDTQKHATEFHLLQEERAALQKQLTSLKKKKEALIIALSVLKECIREYQYRYIGILEDLLSRSFARITHGKYSVALERATLEPVLSAGSQSKIKKESLSVGAQEQLYFAMRLSMAYLLSKNILLPFLLDDPFVHYDAKRLENVRFILSNVKKTNQIILFVHDPSYMEWSSTVINLNNLQLERL